MPRPRSDPFRERPTPSWYRDAKLGIFVHWGVYSVPGWAPVLPGGPQMLEAVARALPGEISSMGEFLTRLREQAGGRLPGEPLRQSPYAEWYWNSLSNPGTPTAAHHAEVHHGRDYRDFAPDFARAARAWDAATWGSLFRESGARYAVLTTKHHDGFCLWPTRTPNPVQQGWHSQRDLVGEFVAAMRSSGLRPGLYYSGGLDWSLRGLGMKSFEDLQEAIVQSEAHRGYVDAHVRELIERFEPSLLWGDIGYPRESDVDALFRAYYERVPDGVVNDRFQTSAEVVDRHYDYKTTEYFIPASIQEEVWEVCEGIGPSFAYNRNETPASVKSAHEIVARLADVVSKNGNMLLGVGPRADGAIPELQRERLLELGDWLGRYGEAVFGSRPWQRHAGTTARGSEVRFTRRGESVYAIVLGEVGDPVVLEGSDLPVSAGVRLLSGPRELGVRQTASGVELSGLGATHPAGAAFRFG